MADWTRSHRSYSSNANALQTVDVWTPPSPTRGVWVIYIHGGAWRDPLVDSDSFTATALSLTKSHAGNSIAGIASVNYSLSPHPNHPTNPSTSKDVSRQAKHPDHIHDVLKALQYLQEEFGFESNYVLIGHSCGATLALQVAMNHTKWGKVAAALGVDKPKAIVGLNGIYDLPSLIQNPGDKHKQLAPIYEDFTQRAFGADKIEWRLVSPISVGSWMVEWPEGARTVLAQSKEDSLVPYSQTEDMLSNLKSSMSEYLEVQEAHVSGDHNEVWQKGDRLAEIVVDVVKSL